MRSTTGSSPSFVLAGVPVRLDVWFFLVAGLLALNRQDEPILLVEWIAVVFISVLIHEFGHAFAFRFFGQTPEISLHAMGGTTSASGSGELTPLRRMAVTAAGPAASIAIGVIALAVQRVTEIPPGTLGEQVLQDAVWANLAWGFINLIPVIPLDGGQILRSGLEALRIEAAERISAASSIVVLVAVGVGGFLYEQPWAVFIPGWVLVSSLMERHRLARWHAAQRDVEQGFRALREDRLDSARDVAKSLRDKPPHDWFWAQGTILLIHCELNSNHVTEAQALLAELKDRGQADAETIARVNLAAGQLDEALHTLEGPHPEPRDPHRLCGLVNVMVGAGMLQKAAELVRTSAPELVHEHAIDEVATALFYSRAFDEALAMCTLRHERFGSPSAAYNAACCLAQLGKISEGLTWLHRALDGGYSDPAMLTDADLNPLRADDGFVAISVRIQKALAKSA